MSRRQQTLADYMVIAVSPTLVMLMVGSLIYFLIAVFYDGPYEGRLCFIASMFTLAAVLIARIAMEQGRNYANLFAIPLAVATLMAMSAYSDASVFLNVGLIAAAWWCADRLTWDCTLADRSHDPSSQGLLQTAGIQSPQPSETDEAPQLARREGEGIVTAAINAPEAALADVQSNVRRLWQRRPNKPGVWVVYFSLAALPMFGLGQWLIPASDTVTRRYVYVLLCVYLASGFGLLSTTSFLGLRLYLRNRQLQMPRYMAAVWLGVGAAKIVALLVVVSLVTFVIWMLPGARAIDAVAQLPVRLMAPDDREPSRYGFGRDGPQDEEKATRTGRRATTPNDPNQAEREESDRNGQSGSGSPTGRQAEQESGSSGAESKSANQKSSSGGGKGSQSGSSSDGQKSASSGDKQQGGGQAGKGKQSSSGKNQSANRQNSSGQSESGQGKAQTQNQSQQSQSPSPAQPSPSQRLGQFAQLASMLMKWLIYTVIICICLVVGWWYREELLRALSLLLENLRQLWQLLFGRAKDQSTPPPTDEGLEKVEPARPFASFVDPFATGMADQDQPDELVRYTFEAFEAWSREHGCPRDPEQTPHEHARRVSRVAPSLRSEARVLADLYCQAAYAPASLSRSEVQPLEHVWRKLRLSMAIA